MSFYSRPIFDAYDDDDEADDGAPPDPSEGDDSERDHPEGDDEHSAEEDDDDRIAARLDDEARDALDEAFPLGDGVADVTATVWCPYCGESSEVAVDPGGGSVQEYVEDCAVCCQPWRVTVAYGADGSATVTADAADA